ncbi:putative Heat stress transcription factor A-6b [Quillaja saponaria]|uniref:Heat stress transcription factor A-6b n=1 Tax=Quillaja saponaria TaxID=32244 RepID=A0AAD7QEH5_QUISA|nr:putative Heat stress transcription factor A-6b [Quillaja saponaria]
MDSFRGQGFRKVDPDKWEFASEGFLRGQKHLLKNIRRRKISQLQASQQALDPCLLEVGGYGLDGEVNRLKRDKQVLMVELLKLRQQQQNTRSYLQAMEDRLKRTNMKQKQMMNFLARAMQSPNFVRQLVEQKDKRKELEEAITNKRRRPIDQGPSNFEEGELGHGEKGGSFNKVEPQNFIDMSEFEVLQLDKLHKHAIEMPGQSYNLEEEHFEGALLEHESMYKDIDEGFWLDLLDEGFKEEEEEEKDVDMLG